MAVSVHLGQEVSDAQDILSRGAVTLKAAMIYPATTLASSHALNDGSSGGKNSRWRAPHISTVLFSSARRRRQTLLFGLHGVLQESLLTTSDESFTHSAHCLTT